MPNPLAKEKAILWTVLHAFENVTFLTARTQ
jgi:hypothetical protein